MLKKRGVWVFWAVVPCCLVADARGESSPVQFERIQLDAAFRSEGVAVGDFDGDGRQDIAAGFVWYQAPDWKMHSIVEEVPEYHPKGYSNSFVNFAHDVNGDGLTDLMVVDFPGTPTWWFENPGQTDVPWPKHELTPVSNNESPQWVDLTGDGQREWVMGVSPDPAQPDGERGDARWRPKGHDRREGPLARRMKEEREKLLRLKKSGALGREITTLKARLRMANSAVEAAALIRRIVAAMTVENGAAPSDREIATIVATIGRSEIRERMKNVPAKYFRQLGGPRGPRR